MTNFVEECKEEVDFDVLRVEGIEYPCIRIDGVTISLKDISLDDDTESMVCDYEVVEGEIEDKDLFESKIAKVLLTVVESYSNSVLEGNDIGNS
jgi:hypothetical protein